MGYESITDSASDSTKLPLAGGTMTGNVTFGAGVDLQFTGGSGTNDIVLTNALADALSITDGSADVIVIDTSGGTNTVAITGNLTATGTIAATGDISTTKTSGQAIITSTSDTTGEMRIFSHLGTVNGGEFSARTTGGSAASVAATIDAQIIGRFGAYGYSPSGYKFGGRLKFVNSEGEAWTNTATGTEAVMQITANDSTTTTDAMTWENNGDVTMENGSFYIGTTSNANMTSGLTINQGASTNWILALKNDMTAGTATNGTAMETNDFLTVSELQGAGGARINVKATDSATQNVIQVSSIGGTATTTKSTSGRALEEHWFFETNGNSLDNVTTNGNVFGMIVRTGGGNSTRWLLDETGDTWQTGDVVMGTAGKGVDFSANTGGAGETSAILDWYEEGTWTPFVSDDNLNASESQAYSAQVGRYWRIGRQVWFQGAIVLTSLGSLTTSDTCYINGLPFTAENLGNGEGSLTFGFAGGLAITAGHTLTGVISNNTTYCSLYNWDATGGVTSTTLAEISADARLHFNGMYQVAA